MKIVDKKYVRSSARRFGHDSKCQLVGKNCRMTFQINNSSILPINENEDHVDDKIGRLEGDLRLPYFCQISPKLSRSLCPKIPTALRFFRKL